MVRSGGSSSFPEPIVKEKLLRKRAFVLVAVVSLTLQCKLSVFLFLFFSQNDEHQMEGHSNL